MKELPDSKIYEQELVYMPYKDSLKRVLDYICQNTPENGSLLDLMCGPGYLLGKISDLRKDLTLKGVDFDQRYIDFSKEKYPHIDFEIGDVLEWEPSEPYDAVICTGSVHHIPYEQQEKVVARMASMVKPDGFVLISDCYINGYSNEKERKLEAAKLGYEYLRETTQNGAPDEVIEATIDILHNDVMMEEFKTSYEKRLPSFKKYFAEIETFKTWPKFESEYGDYITICRKNKI